MFRYALILVLFISLILYVFKLAAQGRITGRFRNAAIALVCLLIALTATGAIYNYKYYSVSSPVEVFNNERERILAEIEEKLSQKKYTQARKQAETYLKVQDKRLEALYAKSREKELQERLRSTNSSIQGMEKRVDLLKKLKDLKGTGDYQSQLASVRQKLTKKREDMILSQMDQLPGWSVSQKMRGFRLLLSLRPKNSLYKKRLDHYSQKMSELLQDSAWNSVCSSSLLDPCKDIGKMAYYSKEMLKDTSQGVRAGLLGEILGVAQRAKGTLISDAGKTASEDAYYYILHLKGKISLDKVDYVKTKGAFEADCYCRKIKP